MAVPAVNLTLEKGTNFEATFNVFESDSSSIDFSNYSGVCKIRKYPTSPKVENCQVTILGLDGSVKISMAKTTTSLLSSGRNYYDVILTSNTDGVSFRVVEGFIIVTDSVSV